MIISQIICAVLPFKSAFAQKSEKQSLRYNLTWDITTIAVSSATWFGLTISEDEIAATNCRWCSVNAFDAWGHNNLRWSNPETASKLSHGTAYLLEPAVAFGLGALAAYQDDAIGNFGVDAMIIAEATAVSALFAEAIKLSVGRQRPKTHYGGIVGKPSDNTSFYSAHTNFVFALAVSSGTVAEMRGYTLAPYIWGAGLAVAATTGYLRIAADEHYITDVLVGAIAGSAFGFGIPYFFHREKNPKKKNFSIIPMPIDGGMLIGFNGSL